MDWLLSLPEVQRLAAVTELPIPARMAMAEWIHEWRPLPHQVAPDGDWFILLMQWGAGSGKTFTGAQLVRDRVDRGIWRTVNVAGPTWVDTMRTMVHGSAEAPGLMGMWPAHQRPVLRMSKDDPHLRCHNGAKIQLFSAQKAERFRGPAGDGGWPDEIDVWKPEGMTPHEAFGLFEQRIRTGPDPRIFVTGTPKRGRLVAELRKRSDCVVTRATMFDNEVHLSPKYVKAMRLKYAGTRIGRQELDGELLPDVEGAIVSLEMIDEHRVESAPELLRTVVAVDPFGGGGDACGIGVVGRGVDSSAYILADRTCRLGPAGWSRRAIETYVEFGADCIAWEANFGGNLVENLISSTAIAMGVQVRLKRVWSSTGKALRFGPVGAMYERAANNQDGTKAYHVGTFTELEDEVTQFTDNSYEGDGSPNRADAMVFAATELFPSHAGPTLHDLYGEPEGAEAA